MAYTLNIDSFAYKDETGATFTQTTYNISLFRAIPWEGMREFTVKQEGNFLHLQFGKKAAFDFNPDGEIYSTVLRVWRRVSGYI